MKNRSDNAGRTRIGRTLILLPTAGLLALGVAGCSTQPSITGVWSASDGSATKTINDDGSCTGMYYNGGKVLDIGGPETCHLSENQTNGFYSLVVQQPPNQETLQVTFDGNTMTLYSGSAAVATLTKQ